MKLSLQIILALLCALLILVIPFSVPSPNMVSEVKYDMMTGDGGDEEDEGEELDFSCILFSRASAEEEELIIEDAGERPDSNGLFNEMPSYELPMDFTVPPMPDPALFTENGYEDESISVTLETIKNDNIWWYVARIRIASPTQIRTATADKKLTSNRTASVPAMARKNNAVIALNGDNYIDKPKKTTFEYRMGQKIRSKTNKLKDILVIDENGDFHLFVKSKGIEDFKGEIVNAFTFGPALVIDGETQKIDAEYGYNPNGKQPRSAIGQTGKLSYVMVVVSAPGDSKGASQQELADFMQSIGCLQAYNLDGGNSAQMAFGENAFKGARSAGERGLSDIIYFATAVPEEARQ